MGNPPSFTRISTTLPTDLVDDIYFEMVKIHGIQDPRTSLGKWLEVKLRPLVADRNSQITDDITDTDDTPRSI